MNHLSKTAKTEDLAKAALKKYIQTVWKSNKGFFENLFSILTYASPVLGVGWLPLAATLYSTHVLGIGLSDFGRWVDEKLGIGPGRTPTMADIDKIEGVLEGQVAQAGVSYDISKRAGIFSAILKSRPIIKLIVSGIKKLLIAIPVIFGAAHLSGMLKDLISPIKEKMEIPEVSETSSVKEKLNKRLEELESKYRS